VRRGGERGGGRDEKTAPNAEKNESVCESSGLVLAESRRGRRGARVEDFAAGFGD